MLPSRSRRRPNVGGLRNRICKPSGRNRRPTERVYRVWRGRERRVTRETQRFGYLYGTYR